MKPKDGTEIKKKIARINKWKKIEKIVKKRREKLIQVDLKYLFRSL